jgi:peroxiredoxin
MSPSELTSRRLGGRILATAAALCACLGAVACGAEAGGAGAGPGPVAPSAMDFALQSTEGKTVHLSDYLGKDVVLIDFWSTTCAPCMVEMPHLVDLYKTHKDKGFVVLAVSLDGPESLADVNRVVHDKEMIFPVLLDQETTVVSRFNPKKEMPFSVLIDRSGKIIRKRPGYQPGDENTLAKEVEKALQ